MKKARIVAIGVMEIVEDVLEEKGIIVPDEDRTGAEEEAPIYGVTYYNLEDQITDYLERFIK